MSAEILHEAASLMRERANAATTGPWRRFGMAGVAGPEWEIVDERRVECDCGEPVALLGCATNIDAEHIASWHPLVALAVADWLDHAAARAESKVAHGGKPSPVWSHERDALAVARAYLAP